MTTTQKTPDITVYFLQASRCIRTVWLLEELGLPYKIEFADRVNKKAPPEFKKASGNPLGKFPVIKDGDLMVHESGAITEYLCDHYDPIHRLIPSSSSHPTQRSQVQTYIHASEATLGIHALSIMYAHWSFPAPFKSSHPEILAQMEEGMSVNVRNDLDWLEGELSKSKSGFLVGDGVTAADIMMAFSVQFTMAGGFGTKGGSWPKVDEWIRRCEDTGSYKRAVEKSGHVLAASK
ncbi:MAG: hypothetical protein M1831_007163 [Alyxoria varia]|nr:MAG: hypothetical protein M1831_007163 [Alyxoria varia]